MKVAAYLLLCGFISRAASEPLEATFNHAVQALSAGDYLSAEQGFQAVLKQQPDNIGAVGDLGILYARTNRADKAIAQYQRALRLSPNDKAILLNLGLVYLRQERHPKALPYFARVVAIDHHNLQARQLLDICRIYTGEVAPAIRDLNDLRTADSKDQQLLFLLAFAYLKNGDTTTAQTVFQQMFEAAPPAQAQLLLGKANYEAALFPQGEESFLKAQQLDPNLPGLRLELAKTYISERRTDDALRELKSLLEHNPNDEEANYFLGGLLVRENRDLEGIPYLEQAKKLKPDSWAVYYYLGRAKLHLSQVAAAVTVLQRAVELNPDDASAQYQLGRALQADGRKLEATRAFGRARELKSGALDDMTIPGVR